MNSPSVSIIIPTHNRADLLPATLDSVLKQTFDAIEVIVVDDGSTDATPDVMATITDNRVRYIRNHWTGHPSPNRNTGIRESKADLLAFVDSDDLWLKDKLEKQVAYLDANPDKLWCFCHYDTFRDDKDVVTSRPIPISLESGHYAAADLLCENFIGSPTVLVKRKLFDQAGLFSEVPALRFVEDWELWLRFSAIQPGGFIPEALAQYRLHPLAATSEPDPHEAAVRCLEAIKAAVTAHPEIYGQAYHQAVNTVLPVMVRRLLVLERQAEARSICRKASLNPIKAGKLAALYSLGLLPQPILRSLLAANRALKTAFKNNQRIQ